MLVYRSLILSFSTYWRLLILWPFLCVIVFVFLAWPTFISPFLLAFMILVMNNFVTLVAIRAALSAIDIGNPPDFFGLMKSSAVFALAQIVIFVFMGAVMWGIVSAAKLAGYSELSPLMTYFAVHNWRYYMTGAPLLATVVISFYVLTNAAFAALTVPMAAAAHAASPKAASTNVLTGFGSGLVGLFIISAITTYLFDWAGCYESLFRLGSYVLRAGIDYFNGVSSKMPETDIIISSVISVLFGIWLLAWSASAAALAWVAYVKKSQRKHEEAFRAPAADPDAIRELRLSRERNQR